MSTAQPTAEANSQTIDLGVLRSGEAMIAGAALTFTFTLSA